ncbi:MAG TPA: catalase [Actinobacteria bacterium]|jgi:catalase|nr:catalase [Actinomycetota bacterium]
MADDLATRVVDSISRNFKGTHDHRAAHAKGFCVSGVFVATPEAGALTRAAHFRGNPVAVTVRFSNGSGSLESADHHIDGRGMAVKFHLPGGEASDIVSISQRTFFVRTPEDFLEFTDARKPDPETGRPDPNAIGDFLIRHPEAEAAFTEVLTTSPPASVATTAYNALHAFRWLDADGGSRWVRYRWVPDAGVATIEREKAKELGRDYLRSELTERLTHEPVVFQLEIAIAEEGDDPDDPTAGWPADRRRVTAGQLELTAISADQDAECERQVFDPMRLTDGIEPSADPILNFRPLAYDVSIRRRLKLG